MKPLLTSVFILLSFFTFSQTFLFEISEVRNLVKSGNNTLGQVLNYHDESGDSYFIDIKYTFYLDSGLVILEESPFDGSNNKIFKIDKLIRGENIYELSIMDNLGDSNLPVELKVVIDVEMTSIFIYYYEYVNNLTVVIDPRQYSFDEIKNH